MSIQSPRTSVFRPLSRGEVAAPGGFDVPPRLVTPNTLRVLVRTYKCPVEKRLFRRVVPLTRCLSGDLSCEACFYVLDMSL